MIDARRGVGSERGAQEQCKEIEQAGSIERKLRDPARMRADGRHTCRRYTAMRCEAPAWLMNRTERAAGPRYASIPGGSARFDAAMGRRAARKIAG